MPGTTPDPKSYPDGEAPPGPAHGGQGTPLSDSVKSDASKFSKVVWTSIDTGLVFESLMVPPQVGGEGVFAEASLDSTFIVSSGAGLEARWAQGQEGAERPQALMSSQLVSSYPTLFFDVDTAITVPSELEPVRSEGILRFFSSFVLCELWRRGSVTSFPDGAEVKIRKDQRLILLEGRISTYLDDATSSRYALTSAEPGVVLGELSSYARSATKDERIVLVADGEVRGLLIPREFFESVVRENPGALQFMLQLQSERLQNMNAFAAEAVRVDLDPNEAVPRSRGEMLADFITQRLGTWRVVAGFVTFSCVWMGLNTVRSFLQWDEYPFVFLNLFFSIVSGLTMPVVLMSQNRQSAVDRFASRVLQLKVFELSRKVAELLDRQTATEETNREMLEHLRAMRAQRQEDGNSGKETTST
jgi:uncharacterized membrane protein